MFTRLRNTAPWLRLLLAGAMLALPLAPVGAATPMPADDAERFIRGVAEDALSTLGSEQQDEQHLRALIGRHVAIDFIGQFGLGKRWRGLDEAAREEFLSLYREFFLQRYAALLVGYQGRELTVTGTKQAGDSDVLVSSRVRDEEGAELPADWRVRLIDGEPKIVDIVVEGVSVAVNQRQEFSGVIERDGMEGLLQKLRADASG